MEKKQRGKEPQKEALELLLYSMFGEENVEQEKDWDWMVTPPLSVLPPDYAPIVQALSDYRNRVEFLNRTWHPKCDYVIEDKKIIIEYDERQHFTEARRRALAAYPKDVPFCFSIPQWMEYCAKLNRHDNDPVYRDEQRAYYEAVRDLEAARHGYKLFRIMEGEFDWKSDGAKERLVALLETV